MCVFCFLSFVSRSWNLFLFFYFLIVYIFFEEEILERNLYCLKMAVLSFLFLKLNDFLQITFWFISIMGIGFPLPLYYGLKKWKHTHTILEHFCFFNAFCLTLGKAESLVFLMWVRKSIDSKMQDSCYKGWAVEPFMVSYGF